MFCSVASPTGEKKFVLLMDLAKVLSTQEVLVASKLRTEAEAPVLEVPVQEEP